MRRYAMEEWLDKYFLYVFPVYFIALWSFAHYLVSLMSGWRKLAKRFRYDGGPPQEVWRWQSARMRGVANYNNALTVGAAPAGLFLAPFILFRAFHPPLLVPWPEITARPRTAFLSFYKVELRLGATEQVPFWITANLASRIEAAAGPAWSTGQARSTAAPPPLIG